jgi:ribosomal protein S18 acetylase RimI-like enzyme
MVVYRPVQTDDYEAVRTFLPITGGPRASATLSGSAQCSTARTTLWSRSMGGVWSGSPWALCDGSNGYISMVAVAEDLRRQGIGRRLVEHLMQGDIDGDITWVLRAGRDSCGFWERLGFMASDIAMERVRRG